LIRFVSQILIVLWILSTAAIGQAKQPDSTKVDEVSDFAELDLEELLVCS